MVIDVTANKVQVFLIFLFIGVGLHAQSSNEIKEYIEKYTAIALQQEKEFGIPAPITLAQGILESGAGTSSLTRNSNNHFGIKAFGKWDGEVYMAWDDEPVKSKFRVYSSPEESFRDHSLILKNGARYSGLFKKSVFDYRAWAVGLQAAGYATAPDYAKALIGYIDAYALYSVNGGVKLRPGKTVTITTTVVIEGEQEEWQMDASEISEEEEMIKSALSRYVVEINDVRCTLLYPGQSLSSISQKYDISKQSILKCNEVTREQDIAEGSIVFLEKKKNKYHGIQDYYRVKEGDTLHSISQKFGITVLSLAKMNGKTLFSSIQTGEKLRLK